MSRKRYKAIAEIMCKMTANDFSDKVYSRGWNNAVEEITARLANCFEQDNPNFCRIRFLKACEIDS